MSELWGHIIGVVIVAMMVSFICIWAWAWSGHHRRDFSRMSSLPMEDDEKPTRSTQNQTERKDI